MHAELLVICQASENSIRDRSYSYLEGSTILSTNVAQCAPILIAISVGRLGSISGSSSSEKTTASNSVYLMRPSPNVLGMRGLTCAITHFAVLMAATAISTERPKEQYPCISGGETWTRATSIGKIPLLNRIGISLKKMGT